MKVRNFIPVAALAALALAGCGGTSTHSGTSTKNALDMTGIPKAVQTSDGYAMTFPAGVNLTSVCSTKGKQLRSRLQQAGLPASSATVLELDGGDNAPGTMSLCGVGPQG
jgi:hypothetical protein